MTKIKIKMADGYMSIEADGHTKSDVCAAVSTLMTSSARYLQELANQFPEDIDIEVEVIENGKKK